MIMLFEKTVNDSTAHAEIRCPESEADLHRTVQQAAGWILVSVIAPKSREWKNTSMKLQCIHGGVCENDQCDECFDFEM